MRATLKLFLLFVLLLSPLASIAQHGHDGRSQEDKFRYEQQVYFEVDKWDVENTLFDNSNAVESIVKEVRDLKEHGATDIAIHITASASLEASESHNSVLAVKRTQATLDYLKNEPALYGLSMEAQDEIYDWTLLRKLVLSSSCPSKEKVISVIDNPSASNAEKKQMLVGIENGRAYEYIKFWFFKYMRYANIILTAQVPDKEYVAPQKDTIIIPFRDTVFMQRVDTVVVEKLIPVKSGKSKFMVGVRTNTLLDIGMTPNLGIDFLIGNNFSVGASWMYGWWNSDPSSFYWRLYGGNVHADYWFRIKDNLKCTGHHIGIYAQMNTFDFEFGGNGVQGPEWMYGGGLSYGYALKLAPKLSLDFNLGFGYLGGTFYDYSPSDTVVDKYYLEDTKQLNYWGPTRAEISLIWKIGRE